MVSDVVFPKNGGPTPFFAKGMWSPHVLVKYWSLQLAGWFVVLVAALLAAELFGWPRKVVWIVVAVWALKDALLYPLVWRSYDGRDAEPSAYPLAGAEGVVLRELDPDGAVRIGGERWNASAAEAAAPIRKGERVRVVGREGMTLFVVPAEREGRDAMQVHGKGHGGRG